MTLQEWKSLVAKTLYDSPEWLAETQEAIMAGVQERLQDEQGFRAMAEASLAACLDSILNKSPIPTEQVSLIKSAIQDIRLLGGTEWQKKTLEKLNS